MATETHTDDYGLTIVYIDVPMIKSKPPLNHNYRLNRFEEARRIKQVRNDVGWSAKAANLGSHRHITVQLCYGTEAKRNRDALNLTATSKPAIDGLVDAGVVPDDNDAYVTELMPKITERPGKRTLQLAIHLTPEQP